MLNIDDKPITYQKSGFKPLVTLLLATLISWIILPALIGGIFIIALSLITGFTTVLPNEAKVITFFGKYIGTLKTNGFIFTYPFTAKKTVSLKYTNTNTGVLKVNDAKGNPIEIGCIIVWRVNDAAKAVFNVDNYQEFATNQSEIVLRSIASYYPYDVENEISLRGDSEDIAKKLQLTLQEKLIIAGIIIEDVRISHLAYAAEIASSMLRRQQAEAVLQARRYLVENALTIVDDTLKHFENEQKLVISDDKKISLINNLLVTLTSEKETHPVLSVG